MRETRETRPRIWRKERYFDWAGGGGVTRGGGGGAVVSLRERDLVVANTRRPVTWSVVFEERIKRLTMGEH